MKLSYRKVRIPIENGNIFADFVSYRKDYPLCMKSKEVDCCFTWPC